MVQKFKIHKEYAMKSISSILSFLSLSSFLCLVIMLLFLNLPCLMAKILSMLFKKFVLA